MPCTLAALIPLTETTRLATVLKANRKHRCVYAALASPLREIAERHILLGAFTFAFDLVRLRGQDGLFFGSSLASDVCLPSPGVAPLQLLLFVDPRTMALTVKNVSSDGLDAAETGKGTDIWVHDGYQLHAVEPGATRALDTYMQVVAGEEREYRFKVLVHPGPFDADFLDRLQAFVESAPEARSRGSGASLPAAVPTAAEQTSKDLLGP